MSKQRVLTDIRIEIDPPRVMAWRRPGEDYMEAEARALESWAREFEDFVRDHRSQDPVTLFVQRDYQEVCSHCGLDWEQDEHGIPVCCDEAQQELIANEGST